MKNTLLRWSSLGLVLAALAGVAVYSFTGPAEAEDAAKPAAAAPAPAAAAPAPAPAAPAAAAATPAAEVKTAASLKDVIKEDAVYATVGDQKVTGKDVNAIVKQLPPQLQAAPADKVLELVVNQLVNDRLVDKIGVDTKLAEDKIVQERIADLSKQVIRERFIEKSLEGKVTDAAVKAKYDELVKASPAPDEVRASHILVTDEKTATEVLAKIAKGEDFAALAKQYSIDPTKANGGDLGYFVKSAMVKEFGDAAFAMNKGDVSKTPVKSEFGYHIIKVVDKRKQAPPAFDQVKDRIKAQVTEEQARKLLEDLRKTNKVELTLPKM